MHIDVHRCTLMCIHPYVYACMRAQGSSWLYFYECEYSGYKFASYSSFLTPRSNSRLSCLQFSLLSPRLGNQHCRGGRMDATKSRKSTRRRRLFNLKGISKVGGNFFEIFSKRILSENAAFRVRISIYFFDIHSLKSLTARSAVQFLVYNYPCLQKSN